MTPPRLPNEEKIPLQRALNEAVFWIFGAFAIFLFFLNWPPTIRSVIIVGIMLLLAAAGIRYRRRRPVFFPPTQVDPTAGLTPLQKAAWIRSTRWGVLGGSALISYITYGALYQREHDLPGPAPVIPVLMFVYAFFGFWTAVLLPVGFGALTWMLGTWRIRGLESSSSRSNDPSGGAGPRGSSQGPGSRAT